MMNQLKNIMPTMVLAILNNSKHLAGHMRTTMETLEVREQSRRRKSARSVLDAIFLLLIVGIVFACGKAIAAENADLLLVPGKSVGKAFLGMTQTEALSQLGQPSYVKTDAWLYRSNSTGDILYLCFRGDSAVYIGFTSFLFKTTEGYGLNDRLEEFFRKCTTENLRTKYSSIKATLAGGGLVFYQINLDSGDPKYPSSTFGLVYSGEQPKAESVIQALSSTEGWSEYQRRDATGITADFGSQTFAGLLDAAKYEEALSVATDTVERTSKKPGQDSPEYAAALCNLALVYVAMGAYEKAEPLLQQALSIDRKALSVEQAAYVRDANNLASLYVEIGAYEKAEPLYQEILNIQRKTIGEENIEYTTALSGLASLFMNMRAYGKAEPLLLQILSTDRKCLGEESLEYARHLHSMVSLYIDTAPTEKAEPLLRELLAIYLKKLGKDHPEYAMGLELEAMLNFKKWTYGDKAALSKAESLWRQALEIETVSMGECHPQCVSTAADLGIFLALSGRLTDSLPYLERALAGHEMTRGRLKIDEQRQTFMGGKDGLYVVTAAVQKKLGEDAKAFDTIERWRAKGLMDLMGTRVASGGRAMTQEVIALDNRINRLRDDQARIAFEPAGHKTRSIADLEKEVSELQQERLAMIEEKTKRDPELGNLLVAQPASLREVQDLLDSDVVLVDYFHSTTLFFQEPGNTALKPSKLDELWAFVVSRDRMRCVTVPVTEKELRETAQAYAAAAANCTSKRDQLSILSARLHSWLVAPIEKELGSCRTVVVVPWDALCYVPFTALAHENSEPWGVQKQVVVSPAAGVYRYLKPKQASNSKSVLAIGNPKTSAVNLKESELEAKAIASMFRTPRLLLGATATETAIKAGIGKPDVVHLACHGVTDPVHPELSHLLLTADAENDGRLEVHEIFGLDWKGVSLVTLSACSSGTGKLGAGSDLIGLTRGFMFAGAPNVLGTLWNVDDESTRLFMEEFYTQYTSGKSKPEAFQLAQNSLRSNPKYAHPYYWAPFVLWGDWK